MTATLVDLKNTVEDIVSYYETGFQGISSIFEGTHLIFDEFQESLLDSKQERENINIQLQLQDILASNEHLRRRDFDHMMRDLLLAQEEREGEVRTLLKNYLHEQKEMARDLRERLGKFKNALTEGNIQRVKEFREIIKEILLQQDARKAAVTSGLKEFREEQKVLVTRLKGLLAKGKELRIRDVKLMLREFKVQHRERIARHQKRAEDIRRMLVDFKRERTARNRHPLPVRG